MNIQEAADEIQLNRSQFQMERFVIGQHHRPEMQYRQLVIEAVGLYEAFRETELQIAKIEAEAEELRATGRKSDAIEAEIQETRLPGLRRQLIGTRREIEHLEELFERYPKYTLDDIEAAQEDYWRERLLRTAHFQTMTGSLGWAQVEAIWQAGLLPELLGMELNAEIGKINTPELLGGSND